MRSRVVSLTLGIFLSCILIACNKPTQPPSDNNQANPGNSAPADTSDNNGGTMSGNSSGTNKKSSKAEAAARTSLTVPAGTVITVRLDESVGSKISQPGQSFSAAVAHDIQVEGNTVIASGATAYGVVVMRSPWAVSKAGRSCS
jgi:hypothetical protein